MRQNYRRFNELRMKAASKFDAFGTIEQQVTSAVIEISMMHESEVPEHKWEVVQEIVKLCKTHKPKGDEGVFRASINAKNLDDLHDLRRAIERL